MKLISLHVKNFRAITDQEVQFSDGITVVSGQNEVGKSSLIDAFDFLLKYKDGSGAGAVKSAQPVGMDAGPEVEAEFVLGEHRIRYRKRWLSQKETVLEFLEGPCKGQALTSGAAHDAAEELWKSLDTSLWEASRLMQATALNQSPLHASTSLRRALDTQAGGTVDETASEPLMKKVKSEVDNYYTDTRKEKQILKDSASGLLAAEQRVAEAEAALESISDQVDKLTELEADVADREKTLAAQSKELAELSERAESARALQAKADEAQSQVEEAQRARDDAKEKVEARQALAAAVDASSKALDELKEQQTKSRTGLTPLEESVTEAQAKVTSIKTEISVVKKDLAAAQLFDRQKRTRLDVERLEKQLSEYESLSSEIATLESSLVPVDKALFDTITGLEQDLALAEASARAGAAQLRVESLSGEKHLLINYEDVTVGDQPKELAVLSDVVVELPGELRVTVAPDSTAGDARQDLERIRTDLSERHEESGYESSAIMKAALETYNEAVATLERTRTRRSDKLDGQDAEELRDQLATHRAWLEVQEEAVEGDIDALTERQIELEGDLAAADQVLTIRQDELSVLKQDLAGLTGQVTNQESTLGEAVNNLEQVRTTVTDTALSEALQTAEDTLERAVKEQKELAAELDKSGGVAAISDHELQEKHVSGLKSQLDEKRSDAKSSRAVLQSMNRDSIQVEYDRANSELSRVQSEHVSLRSRAEAALLLETVLLKHQEETHRRYVEPFRAALRELGQAMYSNPSFDVEVDHDLTVTGRIMDGKHIPFDNLSTGAKEQMAILIRLATSSLVSAGDAVPVLFDDTLGYSDRRRLHRVVEAIGQSNRQIVIFTANDDRFAGLTDAHRVQL